MKVLELIENHASMKEQEKELGHALRLLRGESWRNGLEKDERLPVLLLRKELDEVRTRIHNLETFEVFTYAETGDGFKAVDP